MSRETISVADIHLSTTKPSRFSFAALHSWVIWQFPRLSGKHMIGAVHPPLAGHGWYPAAIDPEAEVLQIFAHVAEPQETPEKAICYFTKGDGVIS